MAQNDPFDQVLQRLGLYERIRAMGPIPTAVMPAAQSNTLEVPCRINGKSELSNEELALRFIRFIHPCQPTATRIRPISLILDLNGTVEAEPVHRTFPDNPGVYPARYRIPVFTGCPPRERVWRAEKFALGTLLYELFSGHRIFQGQSDNEVQLRYSRAAFPDLEEEGLPILFQNLIYACWSADFGRYVAFGRFRRYIDDNPIRFGLQVTGAVISTAALITVPILGAVGFSALGPVAGSAAAGWQASIGAVEAGSLFAWCQSVTMGGAAVAGLTGTGVGAAAVTGALGLLPSVLRETFIRKFRASL
jgi:hypothetical protein